ncbi:MAG TPA: hypothetical protein DCE77_11455 [Methylophaga sp.]|jgi:hypothetical protein|uniref:hypothetical protein n=1 Tax=unclassified Methylophaga TaxID=2629249 RepID=UPI000C92DE1D|nr:MULTISPECIES: hypothetical protein [unclassified Methylophaga]MAP27736.1 hypothetical protein [Methylophaga sp.]HAD32182.1 hypothetical protein [Methylophaga sp.]HBX59871.1 hypothetical protein [Methylophaga sp.]|tara:strand:+ start:7958 stop:8293 length:336 start_codon:yes stop_codon:yes gene_type:complete
MSEMLEIKKIAKGRMKGISFGDPVTNVCAGELNPLRHCFFVDYKDRKHIAVCTDGKGKFADFDANVIYGGHLSYDESVRIFKPIWKAQYGRKKLEKKFASVGTIGHVDHSK